MALTKETIEKTEKKSMNLNLRTLARLLFADRLYPQATVNISGDPALTLQFTTKYVDSIFGARKENPVTFFSYVISTSELTDLLHFVIPGGSRLLNVSFGMVYDITLDESRLECNYTYVFPDGEKCSAELTARALSEVARNALSFSVLFTPGATFHGFYAGELKITAPIVPLKDAFSELLNPAADGRRLEPTNVTYYEGQFTHHLYIDNLEDLVAFLLLKDLKSKHPVCLEYN